MASWKENNTLKSIREAQKSSVKWKKDGSGKYYWIKAEGYPSIVYDKTYYAEDRPYKVEVVGVDRKPVSFRTRQEAQAYAEDHPRSEFPPITSGPMINPEYVARSEAKGWKVPNEYNTSTKVKEV